MTSPENDLESGPHFPCALCGHADVDHVLQDIELAGGTVRRTYCEQCEEWHDFVLDPRA